MSQPKRPVPLLFGAGIGTLAKAHVDTFTRKDGTVVQAHDTKVQAKAPTPALGANHAALAKLAQQTKAESRQEDDLADKDAWHYGQAAEEMKRGDHEALARRLNHAETDVRETISQHIHPDHWPKLGLTALDHDRAVKKYHAKFGAPAAPAAAAKPAAKKPAAKAPAAGGPPKVHHSSLKPGDHLFNSKGQKVDEVESVGPAMHAAERTVHTRAGYEHVTQGGHLHGVTNVKPGA